MRGRTAYASNDGWRGTFALRCPLGRGAAEEENTSSHPFSFCARADSPHPPLPLFLPMPASLSWSLTTPSPARCSTLPRSLSRVWSRRPSRSSCPRTGQSAGFASRPRRYGTPTHPVLVCFARLSCRVFLHGKVHADYRRALNVLFTRRALSFVSLPRSRPSRSYGIPLKLTIPHFIFAASTSLSRRRSTDDTSSRGCLTPTPRPSRECRPPARLDLPNQHPLLTPSLSFSRLPFFPGT